MEVSSLEEFSVWTDPGLEDIGMLPVEEAPLASNDRVALGEVTDQFQDYYMKVCKLQKGMLLWSDNRLYRPTGTTKASLSATMNVNSFRPKHACTGFGRRGQNVHHFSCGHAWCMR